MEFATLSSCLVNSPNAAGGLACRSTLLLEVLEPVNLCLERITALLVGRARPFDGLLHFTHECALRCNQRLEALAVRAQKAPAGWPHLQRSIAKALVPRQAHYTVVEGK